MTRGPAPLAAAAAAAHLALGVSTQAQPAPPPTQAQPAPPITRKLLEARPIEAHPGWETRLYLIEYAPGAAAPAHRHRYAGLGYVLAGQFESAFGDDAPQLVQGPASFVDPPGAHRLFRNPSATEPLRFLIAYSIPVGAPPLEP